MRKKVCNEKNMNISITRMRSGELDILNRYTELLNDHARCPNVLLTNFIRCIRTQEVTKLIVMYEMFKRIVNIHGSIVEIGVLEGFDIFALAHLSEIFEPRNYTRTIFGFDTFEGYPKLKNKKVDKNDVLDNSMNIPKTFSFDLIQKCVDLYNDSIIFNQFKKLHLIKGDVLKTIPQFVKDHSDLIVSMIICHCGVYKPTLNSLSTLYSRMPKGGVVVFGTANFPEIPGETKAIQDALGISNIKLERLPFSTKHSFFIKE